MGPAGSRRSGPPHARSPPPPPASPPSPLSPRSSPPASAAAPAVRRHRAQRLVRRGPEGWTATSSCAPLCSVTNAVDPDAGASGPGSATVIYTTLGGLLGGLAVGHEHLDVAELHLDERRAGQRVALARAQGGDRRPAGGRRHGQLARPAARPDDRDRHDARERGASRPRRPRSSPHTLAVDPSLLRQGHAYRLLITTNLVRGRAAQRHPRVLRRHQPDRRPPQACQRRRRRQRRTGAPARGRRPGRGSARRARCGQPRSRLIAPRVVRFTPGPRAHAARAGHARRQGGRRRRRHAARSAGRRAAS